MTRWIKKAMLTILAIAAGAFLTCSFASAQDEQRRNEKNIEAMRREARELEANGRTEQAALIFAKANEIESRLADEQRERARQESRKRPDNVREREQPRRDVVNDRERNQDPRFRPPMTAPQEFEKRLNQILERSEQLKIASQHLKSAGCHDLAMEAMKRSELLAMEAQKLREHRAQIEREQHHHDAGGVQAEVINMLRELRQEVERLRAEVHELHRTRNRD